MELSECLSTPKNHRNLNLILFCEAQMHSKKLIRAWPGIACSIQAAILLVPIFVPVDVEGLYRDGGVVAIDDLRPGRIPRWVIAALDGETRLFPDGRDELDDVRTVDERPGPPVEADEAEEARCTILFHPMSNLSRDRMATARVLLALWPCVSRNR
jgi:hypothetical protein